MSWQLIKKNLIEVNHENWWPISKYMARVRNKDITAMFIDVVLFLLLLTFNYAFHIA